MTPQKIYTTPTSQTFDIISDGNWSIVAVSKIVWQLFVQDSNLLSAVR